MPITIKATARCANCGKTAEMDLPVDFNPRGISGPSGWRKDGAMGTDRVCSPACVTEIEKKGRFEFRNTYPA